MNAVYIDTLSDKNIELADEHECDSTNSNNSPSEESIVPLPCPPLKPGDTDCCGSGCVPCVFDIYEQDLKIWRKECRKIKEKQKNDENLSDDHLLSDSEYRKFCITEIRKETNNCFRYRLKLSEFSSLGLKIGQHIIIRDTNNGSAVSRQYTPISDVCCLGHFDLLIKIYDRGKMSQCVRQWSVGTGIEVRGPFGNLQYSPNKYRKLLLLAAGTGIAPMSQVIQCILGNEEDDTLIQLFYACKSYEEILMKSELNEWSSFWNFSVTYVLSQETGNGRSYRYGDEVCEGRIDLAFLTKNVSPSDINSGTFILVCGTKAFDNDMIEHCKLLSYKDTQIHRF